MAKPTLKPKKEKPPRCVICGSLAAGVYYKVQSCDGCRSFFRRMVYRGQRNLMCNDRENRTIAECRAKTNCKQCRLALCLRAGMRPWYLRESSDVYFPFPLVIPSVADSEVSEERRSAALLHADIAHESMRLSKYEPAADQLLTLNSLLSTSFAPYDVQNSASSCDNRFVPLRKKDRLSTDLACAAEYIKAFEFFPSLSTDSKCAIMLKSALVLTNFTSAFSALFMGTNRRDVLSSYYSTDFRPIEIIHRIALSVQEASIVKALIVCNPAIEGIDFADLATLRAENDEYGRMLFALLKTNRGSSTSDVHSVLIQAPVIFVEIVALFDLLLKQAQTQKGHLLFLAILDDQATSCPLLNDVMMS